MPLTLEQYVERLAGRTDLPWPAAPKIDPPKAKPHLAQLPIKAIMWTVYGTLVAVPQGELLFEHAHDFVTDAALDKVIKEFKMWNSMSRKPGKPSEYMRELYTKALGTLRMTGGGEAPSEKVWDDIVKKLFQKDYQFDASFYGSLNEYSRKIAYFFHASLQGTACYRGGGRALQSVAAAGLVQGLCGDGQSFTAVQLQRSLDAEDGGVRLDDLIPEDLRVLSCEVRGKKPSDRLFRAALEALAAKGIEPPEVLHVGSRMDKDLIPAKRLGLRTALFASDRAALSATPEQLKDPATRPDVLLTKLKQIADVVSGEW